MSVERMFSSWQQNVAIADASELFIRCVYAVLLWSTIKLMCIGDVVWGSAYIHLLYNPYEGIDQFAMLLNNPAVRPYWSMFAFPFAALLFLGVLGFHHWITRALVAYLFVVLHFGNVEISTGGHHLVQQLLFFHVLLFRIQPDEEGLMASFKQLLHHLAFYAIWLQIGILYFVSGFWKLTGELWPNGQALWVTLSYKEFGFLWLSNLFEKNIWYLWLGTQISLWYQLLFIFLIWIKPIRKYYLFIGAFFHMSIAFILGITDFGLYLLAAYAIFIPTQTASKTVGWLDRLKFSRAYLPS